MRRVWLRGWTWGKGWTWGREVLRGERALRGWRAGWSLVTVGLTLTLLSGVGSAQSGVSIPQRPEIFNLSMPTANTEYSFTIPSSTQKIKIRGRGHLLKMAWKTGTSGTTYIEIPASTAYCGDGFLLSPGAIQDKVYLQSPDSSVVAEIEIWR